MKSEIGQAAVRLAKNAIRIDGNSVVVLCSSLFYFRIPRGLWRDRLEKVKACGYNCIDVYFPWNYHEAREGEWDFSGEKDARQFLREAAECGLWVVARPGPYICSEWDGGALPAYLLAEEGMRLRENNPLYLSHVERWYARIMPILREAEWGQGGSVIAVQLENELDFYGCADPHGYIAALRDMALGHGITVPLLACAGQGGLHEASGSAAGVVPTCNFYPNDRDPEFENKVLVYADHAAQRDVPLMVTETNRSHFLLRRLLSCGAKLLGPYLQASGTNFGFTNAINNWGNPLSFLTSDYDFSGMISPEGHLREEAYEGRLLRRILDVYGEALAAAEPEPVPAQDRGPRQLSLSGGGRLLFAPNVGESAQQVRVELGEADSPASAAVTVQAGRCPILPLQVPLSVWGLAAGAGTLSATAELFYVARLPSRTVLMFHTEGDGEIRLAAGGGRAMLEACSLQADEAQDGVTVMRFAADRLGSAVVRLPGGERIELLVLSREQALLLERYDEARGPVYGRRVRIPSEPQDVPVQWSIAAIDPGRSAVAVDPIEIGEQADYLERHGVYRGYAWYEAEAPLSETETCLGMLVQNAGDVISLYADGVYAGTAVPGGSSRLFPLTSRPAGSFRITARTEIWGHSNFDDARLPALSLHALRGLTGAVAVTSIQDITQNWTYRRGLYVEAAAGRSEHGEESHVGADAEGRAEKDTEGRKESSGDRSGTVFDAVSRTESGGQPEVAPRIDPIVSFGGWLSAEHPAEAVYRRRVTLSPQCDSWTLHLPGLASQTALYIDGAFAGTVHPQHPYADLTPWAAAGGELELALAVTRWYGSATGKVLLYEGTAARQWRLSSSGEADLSAAATAAYKAARPIAADAVRLKPGQMSWLYGRLDDDGGGAGWRVYAAGSSMKLTAFFNGRLVGRLWLHSSAEAACGAQTAQAAEAPPAFRGGSANSFYVPGVWFREADNELALLLEAVRLDAHIGGRGGAEAPTDAVDPTDTDAPSEADAYNDNEAYLEPLRFVPAASSPTLDEGGV